MQKHMVYLLMSDVIRPIKTQKTRKCSKGTEPRGKGGGEGSVDWLPIFYCFLHFLLSNPFISCLQSKY